MKVQIWLKETSQPIEYDAFNTYEKGSFYCVYERKTGLVWKYPVSMIFRVAEDYGPAELRSFKIEREAR
jgi:hypothetical protein